MAKKKIKVIVRVEGGIVTDVLSDSHDVQVFIQDFDAAQHGTANVEVNGEQCEEIEITPNLQDKIVLGSPIIEL